MWLRARKPNYHVCVAVSRGSFLGCRSNLGIAQPGGGGGKSLLSVSGANKVSSQLATACTRGGPGQDFGGGRPDDMPRASSPFQADQVELCTYPPTRSRPTQPSKSQLVTLIVRRGIYCEPSACLLALRATVYTRRVLPPSCRATDRTWVRWSLRSQGILPSASPAPLSGSRPLLDDRLFFFLPHRKARM